MRRPRSTGILLAAVMLLPACTENGVDEPAPGSAVETRTHPNKLKLKSESKRTCRRSDQVLIWAASREALVRWRKQEMVS